MPDEENPREWYTHDGRIPAPPPVKVSASILGIVAAIFLAYAFAVLFTGLDVGIGQRLLGVLVLLVIGLVPATMAYQLLRGNPLARMVTLALVAVGLVLQVMWFQLWFCWTILFSAVIVAGLVVPDSNRFFAHVPPEDDFSRPT